MPDLRDEIQKAKLDARSSARDRRSSRRRSRSRSRSRDRKRHRGEERKSRTEKRLKEDKDNLMLNFYEGDDCNFEDPGDPDAEGSEALDEIPLPVTPDKVSSEKSERAGEKTYDASRSAGQQSFGLGSWLSTNKSSLQDKRTVKEGETGGAGQNSDQQFPEPVPTAAHRNKRPLLSPDAATVMALTLNLRNKNPVVALHEYCKKRLISNPKFTELREGDNWRMDIEVDGHVFKCPFPRPKKKVAKADAAKFVLKELGLYE